MPISLRAMIAIAVAVMCLAATPPLWSQEGECLRREAVVNVVDEEGNPVSGLTAEDFRGEFRGEPVKILSVERAKEPPRIVVLLDVSETMLGPPSKWELAKRAAQDAILRAPAQASVALVLIGGGVKTKLGFEVRRQAMVERLRKLNRERVEALRRESSGGLIEGVRAGLTALGNARAGDAIYAISDGGGVNFRERDLRAVEQELLRRGVRLYGFLFRQPLGPLRGARTRWEFPWVQEVALTTGGHGVRVYPNSVSPAMAVERYQYNDAELAALAQATGQLYREMGEFYRVEVKLPREVDKTRDWELELTEEKREAIKGAEVIYPRRVVPCEAGNQ